MFSLSPAAASGRERGRGSQYGAAGGARASRRMFGSRDGLGLKNQLLAMIQCDSKPIADATANQWLIAKNS